MNLVSLFDVSFHNDTDLEAVDLVMEVAGNGNLAKIFGLQRLYGQEERCKHPMAVVASAFSYLHTQGVVYWDLKLENRGQIIDRTNNNQTCTYVPTCRHQDHQGLPRLLGALSFGCTTQ